MRVFKILTIFSLFIYVLCIVIDVIHDEWQAKIKFKHIYKDNLINNGQKRIVLYGSSHCDYGLSAREFQREPKLRQSIYVIMELKGKDTIKNLKVN